MWKFHGHLDFYVSNEFSKRLCYKDITLNYAKC